MSTITPSEESPAPMGRIGRDEPMPWKPRPAAYHSFLLRLWRDQSPDNWRASLQSTKTGERHSFADLDTLLSFLLSQTQAPGE